MKINKEQALVILEELKKLLSKKEYKRIEKRITHGLFYENEFQLSEKDEETVREVLISLLLYIGIYNIGISNFERDLLASNNLKYGVICFVRNTKEEGYRVRFSDGKGGFTDRFDKPCKKKWKIVNPIDDYEGVKILLHSPILGFK